MSKCIDKKSFSNGYTVIELAIALSVIGMVILMVTNFTVNNIVQYAITNTRANLLGEAQLALDVINDDIRLSAGADQNNRWEDEYGPGGELDVYSWESAGQTLILATLAEDSTGEIVFADTTDYIPVKNNIIYYLENDKLYRRTLAAPIDDNRINSTCPAEFSNSSCPSDREIMNNVTSFSFNYIDSLGAGVTPSDARAIEVAIELSEPQYGQDVTVSYTTRMVFRND